MTDAIRLNRLRGLAAHLRTHLRGQDAVLDRVCSALARGEMGLGDPARPRGSFLFIGPTGTGKTELAQLFTDYLFGPGHLVSFDLSEYQNKSAVERLLGADRSDPGLLGRALAAHPTGTLLFDEMEKAHPDFLDLFLQMLWHGRITLSTGETKSLTGHYLVATTNIGAAEAMHMEHSTSVAVEAAVLRRVEQTLRPELIGRFDEKLVFRRLSYEVQREICDHLVTRELERLRRLGFDLEISLEALDFLVREGHHPHLGARPMRRVVERHIQDAVTAALFAKGFASGKLIPDQRGTGLVLLSLCHQSGNNTKLRTAR